MYLSTCGCATEQGRLGRGNTLDDRPGTWLLSMRHGVDAWRQRRAKHPWSPNAKHLFQYVSTLVFTAIAALETGQPVYLRFVSTPSTHVQLRVLAAGQVPWLLE